MNPEPRSSPTTTGSKTVYQKLVKPYYNQLPSPPSRKIILKVKDPEEKPCTLQNSQSTYSSSNTTNSPQHSPPIIKGGVTDISRNPLGAEYRKRWDPYSAAINNLQRIFSNGSDQLPYSSSNDDPVEIDFWDQWYNTEEKRPQISLILEEVLQFFF